MNKIKHLLAIAVFLTVAIPALKAQDEIKNNETQPVNAGARVKFPKKTPEQKAKLLTDTLSSIVSLSTEQYSKVYASNLKYATQKESLKSNHTGNFEELKEQMKAVSKTRRSEIAAILTPEQISKWEAWKQARKQQRQQNNSNGTGTNQQLLNSQPLFDDIGDM